MKPSTTALLIVVALSLIGLVSDFYFKRASSQTNPFMTKAFLVGIAIYIGNAFAWVLAMQRAKLAFVGAVYCVTTILCLAAIGYFFFNERLNAGEALGFVLAVASIFLLVRYA